MKLRNLFKTFYWDLMKMLPHTHLLDKKRNDVLEELRVRMDTLMDRQNQK